MSRQEFVTPEETSTTVPIPVDTTSAQEPILSGVGEKVLKNVPSKRVKNAWRRSGRKCSLRSWASLSDDPSASEWLRNKGGM